METQWSDDIKTIGDFIANMTLAKCVQLSEYLEEIHGIKCAGGVPQIEVQLPQKEVVLEQQTEWTVVYEGYDIAKKINLVKTFRELTSQGLKEAMDFITNGAGKVVKEGIGHLEANDLKTKLEAAGAKISLK